MTNTTSSRRHSDGLFIGLLLVLLGLLVVLIAAWVGPEVKYATGIRHPDYPSILIGVHHIDQLPFTRWLGFAFGIGVILIFSLVLLIGNRKAGQITSIKRILLVAMGLYFIIYTIMVVCNWSYMNEEATSPFLSLPPPTAWMIFGMWFCPMIITYMYITRFEEYIISEEEERAFFDFLNRN